MICKRQDLHSLQDSWSMAKLMLRGDLLLESDS